MDDDQYELVFDDSDGDIVILCTVDTGGVVPVVSVKPDLFMSGRLGDPRPVVAAVNAMHSARTGRSEP